MVWARNWYAINKAHFQRRTKVSTNIIWIPITLSYPFERLLLFIIVLSAIQNRKFICFKSLFSSKFISPLNVLFGEMQIACKIVLQRNIAFIYILVAKYGRRLTKYFLSLIKQQEVNLFQKLLLSFFRWRVV